MHLFRICARTALASLLSTLVFNASAQARSSHEKACIEDLKYPDRLRSSFEAWATDRTFSSGEAESECQLTRQLVSLFDFMQGQIAKEPPLKSPLRGTHSKGVCLSGSYSTQLAPTLSEAQKAILKRAPLFASDSSKQAKFRFANASSRIRPDWKADVRALSIKVTLQDGLEQDFAFNNVARFQIDSLDHFVRVMELQKGLLSGQIKVDPQTGAPSAKDLFFYFNHLYGPFRAGRHLLALKKINKLATEDLKWHDSYATQNYWSTTSFALSPQADRLDQVVKFGAIPCDQSSRHTSKLRNGELASEGDAKSFADELRQLGIVSNNENYLSESLVHELAEAPICYQLTVQFLSEEEGNQNGSSSSYNRRLVENPSLPWHGPIHVVGRLTINEPISDQECDRSESAIDVMANSPGIYGLGQINRARAYAEARSKQNRERK